MLKVINFLAEPSAGKSTTAAGLFFLMKQAGCRVELVTEYAKELTWEKNREVLKNQELIFAEQAKRQNRLIEGNEFIITDSPLVLGICYKEIYNLWTEKNFEERVMKTFNSYDNYNVWVKRTRPYRSEGRNEDKCQAEKIHDKIVDILQHYQVSCWEEPSDFKAPWRIFARLKKWYPRELGAVEIPLWDEVMAGRPAIGFD